MNNYYELIQKSRTHGWLYGSFRQPQFSCRALMNLSSWSVVLVVGTVASAPWPRPLSGLQLSRRRRRGGPRLQLRHRVGVGWGVSFMVAGSALSVSNWCRLMLLLLWCYYCVLTTVSTYHKMKQRVHQVPHITKEQRASLILVSFTYINLRDLKNILLGRDAPISDWCNPPHGIPR